MNNLRTIIYLIISIGVIHFALAQQPIKEPCGFEGDCEGGSVTLSISGPSNAFVNDEHTYYVSVSGGTHYSTSYYVSGGSIQYQSKSSVRVKWTSAGSSRYVRVTASTSGGSKSKYKYVNVTSCSLAAGSIGNAQTVCYNGNPSTITSTSSATGGSGAVSYQWQHRSVGGSWSNISGARSTTYNPPSLTSTKEYRRRVQSCGLTKYTNVIRITVRSSLNAGSIGNAQTVCYNGNPSTLSNTSSPSGGNGSYSYLWQSRSPGGSWSTVSGATGSTYNPPVLTSTKEYRRRVQSCGQTKYSNVVTVTVRSSLNGGSISNAQTVCYNGNPSSLSNASSASGGDGNYNYTWQNRSPGGSWSTISGAVWSTYNPPTLTSTKEYRRKVQSCGQTKYSNTITVTVRPSLTAGSIGNAQTVCNNGNPSALSNTSSASGGDGNFSYQWQTRSPGGSWSTISGAISSTYNPPALTSTKEYRRRVQSCGQTKYTGAVTITVRSTLSAGSIGNEQSICNNGDPTLLTNAAAATGGDGSYSYQWQNRPFGGTWSNISGANNVTYDPPVLTESKEYRRRAQSCSQTAYSNSVAVTLTDPSIPSEPTASSNSCGVKTLTRIAPPAGETWYWQTEEFGEDTSDSSETYEVSADGTYYLRSRTSNGCWSPATSVSVTNILYGPDAPTIGTPNYELDQVELVAGTSPVDETWYWQTTDNGVSELNPDVLTVNSTGTFYLRSKSDNGCWSEPTAVMLTAEAPTNVVTEAISNGSILISWTGTRSETGFSISRATSQEGEYIEVHSEITSNTEYLDTGLSTGTQYFYRVQTMLGAEKSIAASAVAGTTEETFTGDESQEHVKAYNGNISAIRWKAVSDDQEQLFTYHYDGLNRLKKAQYAAKNASGYQKSLGHYSVPDIKYDLNGNILELTRQGLNQSDKTDIIDVLAYDYHNGATGNQLMSVTDSRDEAGFADGNKTGDDYLYDDNGNMIQDLNKGITNIKYNHLNLPSRVTFDEDNYILYTYDAAGIKLKQEVYKEGVLEKTTDYVGQFIYETKGQGDRKLEIVQHEEGRIVPKYALSQPELIEGWDYQYHLKDHLGNVRVTFNTTPENYTMVATMEDSNESENFFNYVAESDAMASNSGTHVSRNSNVVNDGLDLNTLLSIDKSDTVKVSAYAYYSDAGTSFNLATGLIESALFGSFSTNTGIDGSNVSQSNFNNAFGSGTPLGDRSGTTEAPPAYINYIFFDRDMGYVTAGFTQISTASNGASVQVVAEEFIADREGYLMIYLSNETDGAEVVVSWDDLEIYHGKTNVVSTQDYYPFGGTFSSYIRTASTAQNFKYNGKELQPETQWYDYEARMYDPWIVRWNHIDPAGEEYFSTSPYVYALNTPINAIDPDGKRVFFVAGAGNDQIGWNYVHRWGRAFERSGISGFTRLNVSHDNPASLRNGSMPLGDMMFSSNFRSSRDFSMADTHNPGMTRTFRRQDDMIDKAISDIETNLADNPLAEGEQLNLAGYSYGSVLQAHAALGLADKGQKIDNLILIGSPISSDSDLFGELSNHDNIGNVIRVDIDEDYFSDPEGMDFIKGIFQNLGIDGAHFDLARPGKEADKRIQEETDNLKKRGVN